MRTWFKPAADETAQRWDHTHCQLRPTGDLTEVILDNPCIPVIYERGMSSVIILSLAEGVLIDDAVVTGTDKQAGLNLLSRDH